ncbi:YetF domain-containing protein [Ectobacillus funiculus]
MHKDWLEQQLHQIGIQSISDVFYAEVQQDGTLYVDKRNDILH